VPDCLHEEKYFPYIKTRSPIFKLTVSHPPAMHHCDEMTIFSSARQAVVRFPQINLFSRLNKLQPLTSLVAPC